MLILTHITKTKILCSEAGDWNDYARLFLGAGKGHHRIHNEVKVREAPHQLVPDASAADRTVQSCSRVPQVQSVALSNKESLNFVPWSRLRLKARRRRAEMGLWASIRRVPSIAATTRPGACLELRSLLSDDLQASLE